MFLVFLKEKTWLNIYVARITFRLFMINTHQQYIIVGSSVAIWTLFVHAIMTIFEAKRKVT
jgi:hypothetical protein